MHEHERECGRALVGFDVLVVEDDRLQRTLVQAKIQEIGQEISVRTAYNGVEGLIKLGERQPQVLITVLLMPGLVGFALLKTLLSSPLVHPIQVVVTTGLTFDEISQGGGLPERVIVLPKPIQMSVLVAMVRAYYESWVQQWQAAI